MNQPHRTPIRQLLWRAYVLSTLLPVLIVPGLFFAGYLYATDRLGQSYGDSLEQQAAFQQLTLNRLLAQQVGDSLDKLLPRALKAGGVNIPPLELIRQLRQRNSFQLADNDYYRIVIERDGSFYDVRELALLASSNNPFLNALPRILANREGSMIVHDDGPHLLTWSDIPVAGWRLLTLSASTTPATMINDARRQLNRVTLFSSIAIGLFCLLLLSITYRNAVRLSHRLIAPLEQINQMVAAIGHGEYQPRREPIEIEEMETSALGLSRMGRELGQARQELLTAKDNLEQVNAELEERVQERTTALKQAYEQLKQDKMEQERLFERLKQAQVQLMESEKMASIGQLAAGVAHEINNPMTYIIANITALRDYSNDLLRLIDAQLKVLENHSTPDLDALRDELDYDYLQRDLPILIEQSLDGADRVKQIVQGLRDFSHSDQQEWEHADLHAGIDSTLKIAHNEIKQRAEVIKEYGDIPEIDCLPSQLNQVFLNLFVNAAHAIKEQGHIIIRTRQEGEQVIVEVEDNGSGMPEEVVKRIFEPFYTTKPVGQGTGLGLALSFGIIQAHHGVIEIASEKGKGSCFKIHLPIKQTGSPALSQNA